MKTLITIIIAFCMLASSCNSSSGSGNNIDKPANNTAVSTSSGKNYGTITCKMDGQQKTFTVSQSFVETKLNFYSEGSKDGLGIYRDGKKEGVDFKFKKSGTTKINKNGKGDLFCIINYFNPQEVTYTGDDVTVVVTYYDQKRLTGTFSGKLDNVYYDLNTNGAKNYPQYIQITDGKFDLHN